VPTTEVMVSRTAVRSFRSRLAKQNRAAIDASRTTAQAELKLPDGAAKATEKAARNLSGRAAKATLSPAAGDSFLLTKAAELSGSLGNDTLDFTRAFEALWPPLAPSASKEALKDAFATFLDPKLSSTERRAVLSAAMRDPLTDVVMEALVNVSELLPAQAIVGTSNLMAKVVRKNKDRFQDTVLSPMASSVDHLSDGQGFAEAIEGFRTRLKDPAFRESLGSGLSIVRAFGRIEAEHLAEVAFDVGHEKQVAVRQAVADYGLSLATGLLEHLAAPDLPGARQAVALLEVTRLDSRASQAPLGKADAAALATALAELASAQAPRPTASTPLPLMERFGRARLALLERLRVEGVLDPRAHHAVDELCKDFGAVMTTVVNLAHLVQVATNKKVPDRQRIEDIKRAILVAGPVALKAAQTFANVIGQEQGVSESLEMRALSELKESVPVMTEAELRSQIVQGLGKTLEEAFVSFDLKPIGSASIGQVHRAQIRLPLGRGVREVAVKVQRPGLDEEFDRSSRVARVFLGAMRQVLPLVADFLESGGDAKAAALLRSEASVNRFKMVEDSIREFIDSFPIERDFDRERRNGNRFRRSSGIHPFVTAPRTYARWSSPTILTMDYVRLEKLKSLVSRALIAQQANRATAPKAGPLPARSSDAKREVAQRAVDEAARRFGIVVRPEDVTVAPVSGGFQAIMRAFVWDDFGKKQVDHPLSPKLKFKFDEDGSVHHVQAPLPVDAARMTRLRDRFFSAMLAQVVSHGMVHGDPHTGNWGVGADGETIVFLDFGNVVELGRLKPKLRAPLAMGLAALRSNEEKVADWAIALSDLPSTDSRVNDVKRDVLAAIGDLSQHSVEQRLRIAADAAVQVLASQGIGLSAVYTQGLKVFAHVGGNFVGFEQAADGRIGFETVGKALGWSALDLADAVTGRVAGAVGNAIKASK
jgi:predicted unusual protein kinase regulating ubiquinone biosynthesis (AarF/ABC1/UbiB family)